MFVIQENKFNKTMELTSSKMPLTGGSELFRNLISSSSLFVLGCLTGLRPTRLGEDLTEPRLLPLVADHVGGGVNPADLLVTSLAIKY
jgi:hypothetical protein